METLDTIAALRAALLPRRRAGARITLVPTMGNLHAGHLQLIDLARTSADVVVASIFVNPLQFGPEEDLDAYPRTLDADCAALSAHGADLVFAPSAREMYPGGALTTRVSLAGLGAELCGASRPGHFDGVATVVTKLFNIVQPDAAVFGRKDLQQLIIIQRLVEDLSLPIEIVAAPTLRAEDGLALSSRNGFLTPTERRQAPALYANLLAIRDAIAAGTRAFDELEALAGAQLTAAGLRPDYITVRRARDLMPPTDADHDLIVLGAAVLGRTRIIDNIALNGPVHKAPSATGAQ